MLQSIKTTKFSLNFLCTFMAGGAKSKFGGQCPPLAPSKTPMGITIVDTCVQWYSHCHCFITEIFNYSHMHGNERSVDNC